MSWLGKYWRSSIGGKVTMAVTGVLLFLFLIGHLAGNLQVFGGQDPINSYAKWLKDHPTLLWSARSGLLVVFVLHVVTAIRLSRQNKLARPVAYAFEDTVAATWASRSMVLSGLSLLGFVVYHLLHFTLGVTNPDHFRMHDQLGRHDVYAMVVHGFRNPAIAVAYAAFQVMLFFHLMHGLQSFCQTIGLNHGRYTPIVQKLSLLFAALIAGGNLLIVFAVLTNNVPPLP